MRAERRLLQSSLGEGEHTPGLRQSWDAQLPCTADSERGHRRRHVDASHGIPALEDGL